MQNPCVWTSTYCGHSISDNRSGLHIHVIDESGISTSRLQSWMVCLWTQMGFPCITIGKTIAMHELKVPSFSVYTTFKDDIFTNSYKMLASYFGRCNNFRELSLHWLVITITPVTPFLAVFQGSWSRWVISFTASALVVKHVNDNLTLHGSIVSQLEDTHCSWDF